MERTIKSGAGAMIRDGVKSAAKQGCCHESRRRYFGGTVLRRTPDARQTDGALGCMKFLVDAQLARRFAGWLNDSGQDALHTLDLPRKNRATDAEVIARAQQDGREYEQRCEFG